MINSGIKQDERGKFYMLRSIRGGRWPVHFDVPAPREYRLVGAAVSGARDGRYSGGFLGANPLRLERLMPDGTWRPL